MAFLEKWSKHFPKAIMYKKPVDKYDGVKCKNKYPAHLNL